ncbi:tyrosinase family protein [Bradyrhizobium vignae]|uniref:tyrosinase family protein n=1 Tax=Bradyrhizobium vignae TaxID=1549949 RepID=UPI0013E8ED00|nr:tyrosinase family protein [Bradyrhizobium vignae]
MLQAKGAQRENSLISLLTEVDGLACSSIGIDRSSVVVISRRNVMLQGAVIGAGVIASSIPGMKALAAGQPPERRTLEGLAWNDPIVATYRDAVGLLKQKSAADKTGWAGLAAIHGLNPGAYKFCPHGNWYFLPWHRAYILTYERIIRQLTNNDDFALPYWDWTTNPTMPEVFLDPKTKDGKPNWLYVDDNDFQQDWKRTWPATDPMPSRFVGPAVLQDILQAPDYESFGTSRPRGQDSLDASWVLKRTGLQGTLERLPHNMVHNSIGGWMPSAMSPRDPIFFMHHCNLDRLWAVWNSLGNSNSDDHFWKDMTFTDNFVNPDGSSYSPKVSELASPETLGYTYGLPSTSIVATSFPNLIALQGKLVTLHASGVPKSPDVKTFTASPSGLDFGTISNPLTVPVSVDAGLIAAVSRRRPVSSGTEFLNFAAAREQRATGARVFAFVRDVATTQPQNTEFRVFLDHPGLNAQTPVSDPGYVGSFGIFVHGEHGGHGGGDANPSFALDLTGAMQRVYAGGQPPSGKIDLQFIPVPIAPNDPVGTLRPGAVEIAFVNA